MTLKGTRRSRSELMSIAATTGCVSKLFLSSCSSGYVAIKCFYDFLLLQWGYTAGAEVKHHRGGSPGPGCSATSRPMDCQGGRKSASLVQLSPDVLTYVPDWVTTSAVQPALWGSGSWDSYTHLCRLTSVCPFVSRCVEGNICRKCAPCFV